MPRPAPVTSATRPSNFATLHSSLINHNRRPAQGAIGNLIIAARPVSNGIAGRLRRATDSERFCYTRQGMYDADGRSRKRKRGMTMDEAAITGAWLRQQRRARGLTQQVLAEALDYSVEVLRKVER